MSRFACRILVLALFTAALTSVAVPAFCVPAMPGIQTLVQPNGEKISARMMGDEKVNWFETTDGAVLIQDETKTWRFAEKANPKKAIAQSRPGKDKASARVATGADVLASAAASSEVTAQSLDGFGDPVTTLQAAGTPVSSRPLMVILVQFADRALITSDATWAQQFFGTSGKTVRTYYNEVSAGRFAFLPATEYNGTSGDGVVRVTLPYAHPNTRITTSTSIQTAVKDAVLAAAGSADFKSYDLDGNGRITNNELQIYTVFAGYESATGNSSPQVWAHAYTVTTGVTADGVKLIGGGANSSYAVQGELVSGSSTPLTIGVPTHELGHSLGLPDLYDYGYGSASGGDGYQSLGVGIHSLMGTGNWGSVGGEFQGTTPVLLDAFSRWMVGFGTPTVATSTTSATLQSSSSTGYSMVVVPVGGAAYSTTPPKTGEWFFIDNRQFTGFDAGMRNHFGASAKGGISVIHVDWGKVAQSPSNPNEFVTHKGVDVEESNFGTLGWGQLDGTATGNFDHYFYADAGYVASFGPTTSPNSALYSGIPSGMSMSTSSASGQSMVVNVTTSGSKPPATQSISGNTLYDTAIEISKNAYPGGLSTSGHRTVILSTGLGWSDALAGSSLAGVLDGPILLTAPDNISGVVLNEIYRLNATKVIILGGRFAVSDQVAATVAQLSGITSVERIGGTTMYDTADLIAEKTVALLNGSWDGTAVFATGANYPDAIAISPVAVKNRWPLLLVDPAKGLSEKAQQLVANSHVDRAIILGGKYAVSESVQAALSSAVGSSNVTRIWGNSQYDTAAAIAEFAVTNLPASFEWDRVAIATGENFPDALAGGVLQARRGSVLMLTTGSSLPSSVQTKLSANKASIDNVTFLGGIYAVQQPVRDMVSMTLSK